jgi:hypothetical protein
VGQFRKKPVVIDAEQLTWGTWGEVCDLAGVGELGEGKPEGGWVHPVLLEREGLESAFRTGDPWPDVSPDKQLIGLAIPTLEGTMIALQGDWIIKGTRGEIYPCKPGPFEDTFEEVTA